MHHLARFFLHRNAAFPVTHEELLSLKVYRDRFGFRRPAGSSNCLGCLRVLKSFKCGF